MDSDNYYDRVNTNRDEDKIIIFKKASFAWAKPSTRRKSKQKSKKNKGKSKKRLSVQRHDSDSSTEALIQNEPFTLKDISLEIGKGELLGIAGAVGSGKTSLLLAIIGDMVKKDGDIQIPDNLNGIDFILLFIYYKSSNNTQSGLSHKNMFLFLSRLRLRVPETLVDSRYDSRQYTVWKAVR